MNISLRVSVKDIGILLCLLTTLYQPIHTASPTPSTPIPASLDTLLRGLSTRIIQTQEETKKAPTSADDESLPAMIQRDLQRKQEKALRNEEELIRLQVAQELQAKEAKAAQQKAQRLQGELQKQAQLSASMEAQVASLATSNAEIAPLREQLLEQKKLQQQFENDIQTSMQEQLKLQQTVYAKEQERAHLFATLQAQTDTCQTLQKNYEALLKEHTVLKKKCSEQQQLIQKAPKPATQLASSPSMPGLTNTQDQQPRNTSTPISPYQAAPQSSQSAQSVVTKKPKQPSGKERLLISQQTKEIKTLKEQLQQQTEAFEDLQKNVTVLVKQHTQEQAALKKQLQDKHMGITSSFDYLMFATERYDALQEKLSFITAYQSTTQQLLQDIQNIDNRQIKNNITKLLRAKDFKQSLYQAKKPITMPSTLINGNTTLTNIRNGQAKLSAKNVERTLLEFQQALGKQEDTLYTRLTETIDFLTQLTFTLLDTLPQKEAPTTLF